MDPVRAELKKLLGSDFPNQRTKAARFVLAVQTSLRRYVFSEALRQSEDDSYSAQQLERVLKCAKQLLELLQSHESNQPYAWENEDGVQVERPALNLLPRHLDMIGRLKQGDSPSFSTATVLASLQWLVDTSTAVQDSLRTDWSGMSKPKRHADALEFRAKKLLDWVMRKGLTGFTRKQVMQLGPASVRSAEIAKKTLLMLTEHGLLTTEDGSCYRVASVALPPFEDLSAARQT